MQRSWESLSFFARASEQPVSLYFLLVASFLSILEEFCNHTIIVMDVQVI